MAQPIPLRLSPRNPQHELEVRLQAIPVRHAEAILAAYEVLQLMHDKGVLELMRERWAEVRLSFSRQLLSLTTLHRFARHETPSS